MFTVLAAFTIVAILIGVIGPTALQALEKHHIVTNPRNRAQWATSAGVIMFLAALAIIGYPAYQLDSLGVIVYALPIIMLAAVLYSMIIYVGFWFADRMWTRRMAHDHERHAVQP